MIIHLLPMFQQSTLERKKKNFSFSRKFPFMKSKDDKSEDGSDQERKYIILTPPSTSLSIPESSNQLFVHLHYYLLKGPVIHQSKGFDSEN